ncbi:MAG: response regulator [Mariprofundaceae bacterium]
MFHYVDDETIIRDLLEAFISDAEYESIGFESAEAYIDYLNSPNFVNPTAVISDVTMPGMNGYELALRIREKYPFQKIILVTGNADDAHHGHAASQLCYTLDKPFKPESFIALLNILEACENAHKCGSKSEYYKQCEFGIHHNCPFHKSKY